MKRYWIEYQETQPKCPMTFWVHQKVDDKPWSEANIFEPPKQKVIPGKGYPLFKVEFEGFTFEFASLYQIQVCIETLQKKHLPRTMDLSKECHEKAGPNSFWLSRLPADVKSWRYRERAVVYLGKALSAFEREIA